MVDDACIAASEGGREPLSQDPRTVSIRFTRYALETWCENALLTSS